MWWDKPKLEKVSVVNSLQDAYMSRRFVESLMTTSSYGAASQFSWDMTSEQLIENGLVPRLPDTAMSAAEWEAYDKEIRCEYCRSRMEKPGRCKNCGGGD